MCIRDSVQVALVVPVKMAVRYVSRMRSPTSDPRAEVAAAVDEYQVHGNPMHLRVRLKEIADSAMPDALIAAVEPYREIPEVAIPVYEQVVADQPSNARALVILANSYWPTTREPVRVGDCLLYTSPS